MLDKMPDFTKKFSDVSGDFLSKDQADIKDWLDSQPREIRNFINNILTLDIETKFATKTEIQGIILGQVPKNSIAKDMLVNALIAEIDFKATKDDYNELKTIYKMYKSGTPTDGIYPVVEWKREDGTLYLKSELTGGTAGQWTTRTITFYKSDGITVDGTPTIRTRTYDIDGNLISEV